MFEKLTEIAFGALLLSGRFVPLALTVLAPIMLNILAFHLFLAPAGLGMPLVLLVLHVYLAWAYRSAFAPMLHARVSPDASPRQRGERRRPLNGVPGAQTPGADERRRGRTRAPAI